MNIVSFDIEEWFIEKTLHGGRPERYKLFDEAFARLLDSLDALQIKGTFFCVGQLAAQFPQVVKEIDRRGHEVGCHSNLHTWLNKMTPDELRADTTDAIHALEDLTGKKVASYRAPAFSIGESNKWAIEILASCGIENDASIFPAVRDFGGFNSFGLDRPCTICHNGATLREFPIGLTTIAGRKMAFSGGGYFRLFPYKMLSSRLRNSDYTIWYFHLNDLVVEKKQMMTRAEYEDYFREPGTLKNRVLRYVKSSIGTGDAYGKMERLLQEAPFTSLRDALPQIDWEKAPVVSLD